MINDEDLKYQYIRLALAIIGQAKYDKQMTIPKDKTSWKDIKDAKNFFTSDWYYNIIDGLHDAYDEMTNKELKIDLNQVLTNKAFYYNNNDKT